MQDTLTLDLRKPVTFAKQEYSALNLTEPTAKQLILASKAGNELEQAAVLIQLNAAVPMGVVEALAQRDFEEAASFFDRFWSKPPPTSASESPASAASSTGGQPKGSGSP